MSQKIKSIEPLVKQLLTQDRTLADCDERLVAIVWRHETQQHYMSAEDFFRYYAQGKFTNSESITRCRRKLEELHPELRGKDYLKRHSNKKQREIIDEVNTIE